MRRLEVVGGLALIGLAIAAATRVADSREGLVAEVVTLLAGLVGIALLAVAFGTGAKTSPGAAAALGTGRRPRSSRDFVLGAGGVLLAVVLLIGLAVSGGIVWAGFGLALLLPMIAGSVYLCVRFLRANP